jgi:uncharacterized membrane protein
MLNKTTATIQLVIGLVVLVVSVGLIVFAATQASQYMNEDFSFDGVDIGGNSINEVQDSIGDATNQIQENIEGAITTVVAGIAMLIAALFAALFALISVFMVLDAVYKLPGRKR